MFPDAGRLVEQIRAANLDYGSRLFARPTGRLQTTGLGGSLLTFDVFENDPIRYVLSRKRSSIWSGAETSFRGRSRTEVELQTLVQVWAKGFEDPAIRFRDFPRAIVFPDAGRLVEQIRAANLDYGSRFFARATGRLQTSGLGGILLALGQNGKLVTASFHSYR